MNPNSRTQITMDIAISGSTGMVGSRLVDQFEKKDHRVIRLVRNRKNTDDGSVFFSPKQEELDRDGLSGTDAVIHLAGEPIVGRWTRKKKKRIKNSRVRGTELLSRGLAECEDPPDLLICASAIGYYGDTGDTAVTEDGEAGDLFLSEVCREWEAAADPAREAGIRVVHMRFGIIMSAAGGALRKMLLPFKLGIGGRIGSGEQWMSWIALDDVVGAIGHVIDTESLEGPVNAVTTNPVRNRQFTDALGTILGRPTIFPLPAFAARLIFGEMADEMLLASTRVVPKKLRDTDYSFAYPNIKDALIHLLDK